MSNDAEPMFLPWADADLVPEHAHGDPSLLMAARVVVRDGGPLRFLDVVEVPPGAAVGRHTHSHDSEEFYIVTQGELLVTVDEVSFTARPGDVVRNRPGGTHELINATTGPSRMIVVELRC